MLTEFQITLENRISLAVSSLRIHCSGIKYMLNILALSIWTGVLLEVLTSTLLYDFPKVELTALQSLYNSTNGDNWHWLEPYDRYGCPWSFNSSSTNPCVENWQGIECSSDCKDIPCYTLKIILPVHELNGCLPANLQNLHLLNVLQLETNTLTGTIPAELGNLATLRYLALYANHLTGTIPAELGNLVALQDLYLFNNQLTGTIPVELGNMVALQYLVLHANQLTGTIPAELGNLIALQYLVLYTNQLTGTIPAELGSLVALQYLATYVNELTGNIPAELGNLVALQYLILFNNQLTGTIPPELGNLVALQYLYVYSNHLTGNIPAELGNMVALQYLVLYTNQLTSSIPRELGNLIALQILGLDNNQLTGTIPPELGNLVALQYLALYTNHLTGNIPAELGNLVALQDLYLFNNQLTGTISAELGNLVALWYLGLYTNQLTGSIPAELGNLAALQYLYLFNNQLTDTIPAELGDLFALRFLALETNWLFGTIPAELGNLVTLQGLDLDSNQLSGSIPLELGCMKSLLVMLLYSNALAGIIPSQLSGLSNLLYLYLHDNQLSGTIPSDLFYESSSLASISLSSNCLTSNLPDSMCTSRNLSEILLDGMGTAKQCRQRIFPATSNSAYVLKGNNGGTIPACLFGLQRLFALQLSGLMLYGSIPDMRSLSRSLRYMSLSYNKLTGGVPSAIWQHSNWEELDLSFNRLNGYISSDLNMRDNTSSLRLQLNRFSGPIPSSILAITNISVLEGNMLECCYDANKLPEHDPYHNSYTCGSDYVNAIQYVWLVCVGLVIGLLWLRHKITFDMLHSLQKFAPKLNKMTVMLAEVIVAVSLVAVVVLLPLYAALKAAGYGTFSSQYSWILSSCFLSGIVPAVLLMFVYNAVLGTFYYVHYTRIACQENVAKRTTKVDMQLCQKYMHVFAAIFVTSAINGAYVYGLEQNVSRLYQALMALALSLFKTFTVYFVGKVKQITLMERTAFLVYSYVIAPYLSELFVSADCFYYLVLQNAPTVSGIIIMPSCETFGRIDETTCLSIPQPFNYEPPFVYSYNCSSSLVTSFAPVFILRYIFTWLLILLQDKQHNDELTRPLELDWLFRLLANRVKPAKLMEFMLLDLAILLTFGVLFSPLAVVIACTVLLRLGLFIKNRPEIEKCDGSSEIDDVVCEDTIEVQNLIATLLPYLGLLAGWFWAFTLFDAMGAAVGAAPASGIVVTMCVSPLLWQGFFLWRAHSCDFAMHTMRKNIEDINEDRDCDAHFRSKI